MTDYITGRRQPETLRLRQVMQLATYPIETSQRPVASIADEILAALTSPPEDVED